MIYDTIVIGGGIGGLQAAIQLGRSLHRVLVIDRKQGRSLLAKKYRNILGYPDGISGETLRERGESQAKKYGVQFLWDEAIDLRELSHGLFEVSVKNGAESYRAKTILVGTGITDPFPSLPGLLPCLGESIFICPDCDGFESIDRLTAVLGDGKYAVEMALILTYYTDKLLIVNHARTPLATEQLHLLEQKNIKLYEGPVSRIEARDGALASIWLESGRQVQAEKAFLAFPGARLNTSLLDPFPVKRMDNGHLLVDPRTKETSYRNIWAVGDIVAHSQQVSIAMGDGSQAAIWIHKRLLEMSKQPLVPQM
ncbi:NAD(P)/FAD-dependent oxidoreductase [Brevibacillus fulvus]|uniref:Thioredoxin reductase n=1 Tax=Brevibacillus fulvus TaxID=1125967 RepID=A0A939BN99_9BACL|nr:NAD(P)/FAD-dependent oxidoreductase [Brevibacillus fulvus]MBM7588675.1 thioredoxin reductase [Brevibacillus fulvus]